jgi:hypothetical protein
MSSHEPKNCPKCGSKAVHKDRQMHNSTHIAAHAGTHSLHGAMNGHPLGLILVGGLWAATKLIHVVSKPWKCENPKCRNEFA